MIVVFSSLGPVTSTEVAGLSSLMVNRPQSNHKIDCNLCNSHATIALVVQRCCQVSIFIASLSKSWESILQNQYNLNITFQLEQISDSEVLCPSHCGNILRTQNISSIFPVQSLLFFLRSETTDFMFSPKVILCPCLASRLDQELFLFHMIAFHHYTIQLSKHKIFASMAPMQKVLELLVFW